MHLLTILTVSIVLIAGILLLIPGQYFKTKELEGEEGGQKEAKGYSNASNYDPYHFYFVDSEFIESTYEQLYKEKYKVKLKQDVIQGRATIRVAGQSISGQVVNTESLELNELTTNEKFKVIIDKLTRNNDMGLEVFEPDSGIVDEDITKIEDALSAFRDQKFTIPEGLASQIEKRKDEITKDLTNQIYHKAKDGKLSLLRSFTFDVIKNIDENDTVEFELRSKIDLKDKEGKVIYTLPISAKIKTVHITPGITPHGLTFFNTIAGTGGHAPTETHLTILGTVKYLRQGDVSSIYITPWVIPSK